MSLSPWTMRRLFLPVSLGLNVFFVFLIAAHVLRYRNYRPLGKLERFLATVPEQLSTEDAEKFKEIINVDRSVLMEDEAQLRKARERVIEALKANPFDPIRFQQTVNEVRAKRSILEHVFEKSFIEAAQKISPQGRQKLAELRVNPG